ncbi:MAG: hypothetical protein JJ863_34295 [Deltaproteobacteria bacterium]|nr:hypothetical protein [Deltaproteobacteria bacterium]
MARALLTRCAPYLGPVAWLTALVVIAFTPVGSADARLLSSLLYLALACGVTDATWLSNARRRPSSRRQKVSR